MAFLDLLKEAQADADRLKEVVVVYWREYRCRVANGLPKMAGNDFKMRLANALKKVSNPSLVERKVCFHFFPNNNNYYYIPNK